MTEERMTPDERSFPGRSPVGSGRQRRFGAASHSRSDEGRDALYVLRHAAARTRHPPRRLLAPASATGYRPEV